MCNIPGCAILYGGYCLCWVPGDIIVSYSTYDLQSNGSI